MLSWIIRFEFLSPFVKLGVHCTCVLTVRMASEDAQPAAPPSAAAQAEPEIEAEV
jgi:hypothetical protein